MPICIHVRLEYREFVEWKVSSDVCEGVAAAQGERKMKEREIGGQRLKEGISTTQSRTTSDGSESVWLSGTACACSCQAVSAFDDPA